MNGLEQAWQKSFTDRRYRIGLHVFFWCVYALLFKTAGVIMDASMKESFHLFDFYSLVDLVVGDSLVIGIYYLTVATVYQSIVYKRRYNLGALYLAGCILLFINGMFLVNDLIFRLMQHYRYPIPSYAEGLFRYVAAGYRAYMTNGIILVQVSLSFFIYVSPPVFCKFFRDRLRMQHSQAALEKQNLQLQMDFIKMQIHPHFLFNTLNNIYSLVTHGETGKSAEMISGLSLLLRYALYDGKSEFIPLSKELGMLRNYIELEEVRSDDIRMEVVIPDNVPDYRLPPFLLLPLVENAFKHGVNNQLAASCLKIELALADGRLLLDVWNSYDAGHRKRNAGGLGLTNLKKRLEYYYEGAYRLRTEEEAGPVYHATLELPLLCPKSDV